MKKMSKKIPKNTMKANLEINYYPNITNPGHLHTS